jgi:hypothetical protein
MAGSPCDENCSILFRVWRGGMGIQNSKRKILGESTKRRKTIMRKMLEFICISSFINFTLLISHVLLADLFDGVNVVPMENNRAASGQEAPKALKKFSSETGFQISGDIIFLTLLVVYSISFIFTYSNFFSNLFQGSVNLFPYGGFITTSGQCKNLSRTP